jgi:hypothetical protein
MLPAGKAGHIGVGDRSQLAEPSLRILNSSNRCGLDHRDNAITDDLGQLRPGGRDHGQVWVFGHKPGSAFGSARGTRTGVCCRYLAEIVRVDERRNFLVISEFRRALTLTAVCRRVYRKIGGDGNCTRVPTDASSLSRTTCETSCTDLPELCRDDAALREVVANWHRLTPDAGGKILGVVREASQRR